jgi:hypothetical protein
MVTDLICAFTGPWQPFRSRVGKLEFLGDAHSELVQHDISFYSMNEDEETDAALPMKEGLECYRENGNFPVLSGSSDRRFMERRVSLILVDSGYKKDGRGGGLKPAFRVVIINDNPIPMTFEKEDYHQWKKRGLVFKGLGASHHLFQASIFGVLKFWESQWVSCLDELDKSVSFRVSLLGLRYY